MNGDCKYMEQGVCCNTTSEWLADFPSKLDCRKCGYYAKPENGTVYVNRGTHRDNKAGETNQ